MAQADPSAAQTMDVPTGLLDALALEPSPEVRPAEVARARRRARERAFDDGAVVEAIASELLFPSAP